MKQLPLIALILIFSTLYNTLFACQCPITVLGLQECDKYEVIFKGKVLSVKTCYNKPGEALFEVQELYKGHAENKCKVLFDCADACFYEFKPGEEWIIYSRYKQVNTAKMDYCSRSRRFIKNPNEDYYTSTSGNDYEDELAFLREKLGIHHLSENKQMIDYSRNLKPDTGESVLILLVSITAIVIFYFIFSKIVK